MSYNSPKEMPRRCCQHPPAWRLVLAVTREIVSTSLRDGNKPTEAFMFYIYGLHLEGDDEIRYVGSTCNPRSRLWGHGRGDGHNPDKDAWAVPNRNRLRMKILQSGVSEADRRMAEQKAIMECRGKGHRLFNDRCATREKFVTPEDVTWWLDKLGDNEVK